MYVAIRDAIVKVAGYSSLKEGLTSLGIESIELEYYREDKVQSLEKDEYLKMTEEGIKILEEQLSSSKIKICALLMHNDFMNKDIEEELDWAVRCVNCAASLGIRTVRIDAVMSGQENIPVEKAADKAIECLSHILDKTKEKDIPLGIENHGSLGNNPKFLEKIFKEINSPRMGLTMDTGNFYWSGKPLSEVYQILEKFAPYTKHAHIKNIKYPLEFREKERLLGWEYNKYVSPIFEGDIDHKKLVDFLRRVNYEGGLTIEDESLGKFPQDKRIEILKKDIRYLKEII